MIIKQRKRRCLQLVKIILFISMTFLLVIPATAEDSFIILNSADVQTMLQNVKFIESYGGTITHKFPPHILIGDIPASQHSNLVGRMNIAEITTKTVDISTVSKYGKTAEIAVNVWNNNYKGLAAEQDIISIIGTPEPGPIIGDMLYVPDYPVYGRSEKLLPQSDISAQILPYGAGFYDTSEYMIGDVAVGIILLESNGSIDANTENWTSYQESNVISEIQAGLNWWIARETNAKLKFTYDIQLEVPTSYEPITRSGSSEQSLWITNAMTHLGYTKYPYYFDNVYDYNNVIRRSLNSDWAFTIFVVDSLNDADGKFANNQFAYAYAGGPFMVMTYDNDGYGISNMDAVTAHELGHTFYALDQYYDAHRPCTERRGYLNIENQNSLYGSCLSNVASIMRSQIAPYTSGAIDTYARQQVGWRDTDADSILDIIDILPSSMLNAYLVDPTNDNTPTYTGVSTTTTTYPNNNPGGRHNSITINKINNLQYRVDGGGWTNAAALDGIFDSSVEEFTFTTSILSDNTHTIEVRAQNTAGNWEIVYANDTITVDVSIIDDVSAPNSITNLVNASYSPNYINWTWTDPIDPDFDKVMIYINGVFQRNVTNGTKYYKATCLTPNTMYEIGTRTVDIIGNINKTWENRSAMTAPAMPRIITVDKSGGGDYTRIQDAIDCAIPGDTIEVHSGTYYENVNVNKQLTLRGIGNPVVDPSYSGSAIMLTANGIRLEGFSATLAEGPGIEVTSNNNTLINNSANLSSIGIFLISSNNNTLSGNSAYDNGAFSGYGIELSSSSNNILSGNNVEGNGEFGIGLYSSNNNTLSGNNARGNIGEGYGSGIVLTDSSNNILSGNNAVANGRGIMLYSSSNNTLYDNNLESNNFGLSLEGSNYNTLKNNIATANTWNFMLGFNENSIDTTNLVNGKPIYYLKDIKDAVYDSSSNAGIFYCKDCLNVTVKDLNLNDNEVGVFFLNTTMSRIQNINADHNQGGIVLFSSDNNTISNNKASMNRYNSGIILSSSNNNTVYGNTAKDNGIDPGFGYMDGTSLPAIVISSSNNNLIYNNNFDIASDDGNNNWNITKTKGTNIIGGPYLGGNFWSNWSDTPYSSQYYGREYRGVDTDEDGLGNTMLPYNSTYIRQVGYMDSNFVIKNGGDYLPLVNASGITITSPDGGENWTRGTTQTIRWTWSAPLKVDR